jgi:glycosyltransferase involved in cell wall biosynthesis
MVVRGFVPDLADVFRTHRAMIVPLRHGGGTRLKILEALAWGLPVVSTSLGAAGLGLVDGQHALIADDAPSFARAIQRLFDDDVLWAQLSRNGRALVEQRFRWDRIGDALVDAIEELARRRPDQEP